MPTDFAVNLQLLGGVWMVQIFPAMIFGLYTRWFSGWALLIGWAAGMIVGTSLSWGEKAWIAGASRCLGPAADRPRRPRPAFAAYNGLTAVIVNIVVATDPVARHALAGGATKPRAADYEDSAVAV